MACRSRHRGNILLASSARRFIVFITGHRRSSFAFTRDLGRYLRPQRRDIRASTEECTKHVRGYRSIEQKNGAARRCRGNAGPGAFRFVQHSYFLLWWLTDIFVADSSWRSACIGVLFACVINQDDEVGPTLMVILTALLCEYLELSPISPVELLRGLGTRLSYYSGRCCRTKGNCI